MTSEKFLTRLIYASTATEAYSPTELGGILESCKRNNPPLGITGMLFVSNNFFLQCLEGERRNINLLYQKIFLDQRHKDVELLELKEVGNRYFDDWTMKYVPSANVISKILRETGMRQFNPYQLDNYTANAMIEAFRDAEAADSKDSPVAAVKRNKGFGLMGIFKKQSS